MEDSNDFEEMNEEEENELLKSDEDSQDVPAPVEIEDSDSSDDEDEEEIQLKNYASLLQVISQNRYSYDSYLQLTEIAHSISDLDKIRESYELFSSAFPLSPELWLKYISVEISIVSGDGERGKIMDLYKRAFKDYFSTDIAFSYANFLNSKPDKSQKDLWIDLIETYGLHCMKGRQFFELYRNFLKATYAGDEYRDLYVDSFVRELGIPLFNMEDSYIEAKVYIQKNNIDCDWNTIEADYNEAKTHLQKILPFEKQLESEVTNSTANLYKEYLIFADKFLDEENLQIIYERMVTDCCLDPTCWLDYVDFLEIRDKYEAPKDLPNRDIFNQTVLDVSLRSIRNCTWNEKMYIKRMRLMERMHKKIADVQEVLEMGLAVGSTPEFAVNVWLEYLSFLRRSTNYREDKECEILRKNFKLCWDTLGKQWGVLADCNCEILQFWGRLEYGPLGDPENAFDLWMTIMNSSENSTRSALWIEFIQLEMRRDLESTRKLFKKALFSPGLDNPLAIASAWVRFERCNGSLKQLNSSQEHVDKFMVEYVAQSQKAFDQSKIKGKKRKVDHDEEVSFKKPKSTPSPKNSAPPQPEVHIVDKTKDNLRVFVSNLDYNITEEELIQSFPELSIANVNLIKSANGRGRGFGYLEFNSEDQVELAISFDRRSIKERPVYISSVLRGKEERTAFKYSSEIEPSKLFVKGLPHDIEKDELKTLFSKEGTVVDVRIIVHKSGKPKGIAYVEYSNEQEASRAIMKLDQTELRGHTMSVAISAPPSKSDKKETSNLNKLLMTAAKKKAVPKTEQKPRMSLIPNSVRKQMRGPPPPGFPEASASKGPPPPGYSEDVEMPPPPVPKSNDDFRKLLQK